MIVAIDGPAGSGKGTVAKIISNKLGLVNLDTGVAYRCVAVKVLDNNLEIDDEVEIPKLLDNMNIEFKKENDIEKVFLNGIDVTERIRTKEVTNIVSEVSRIVPLRIRVTDLLRKMAEGKDVVMEGRDITTYVFPNAEIKIYLDAKIEERAKRRYKENIEKGIEMSYEEVLENVIRRDKNDKNKKVGALKIADDAIVVDTTEKTISQVADEVEKIIYSRK
ncbi:MAG: (d)CMP kinase [Clostridia bacterium]|nr:(d)CMP kinase [Clostridia bacterium]